MKYVLHPEADEELAEAVQYYADIDAGLRGSVLPGDRAVDFRSVRLSQRFRRFDPPARRHFSHSFPYAVVYDEADCV